MEISDQLRCLFSATVEEQGDSYIIEVPEDEIRLGDIQQGETYRVAVLPSPSTDDASDDTEQGERVTVEITDVRENVAFAEVVERVSYYD